MPGKAINKNATSGRGCNDLKRHLPGQPTALSSGERAWAPFGSKSDAHKQAEMQARASADGPFRWRAQLDEVEGCDG